MILLLAQYYLLIFSKKSFFSPFTVQRDLLVLYSSAKYPVTVEAGNNKMSEFYWRRNGLQSKAPTYVSKEVLV